MEQDEIGQLSLCPEVSVSHFCYMIGIHGTFSGHRME